MLLLSVIIFLPLILGNTYTKIFDEAKHLIENASSHVRRVNNDDFFSSNTGQLESIDIGTYDFIIIGGGTAGGVLANRLTEEDFNVLVLEAGGADPDVAAILGLAGYLASIYDWGYNTTAQTQACLGRVNKQCVFPRGRVLGGTSILNAAIYARGNPRDYDIWEEMGNIGWSYADVLPYFKKAEKADFTIDIEPSYHGFNGPQHVNIVEDTPGLTPELLQAFNELGKPDIDYNGKSQDGASRIQFFLDFNKRASTAEAYIRPVENRTNLHISFKSYVTKINIISEKAHGVEFVKCGKRYSATARKEVIVSAGTINSPQVLMLSGIGPANELDRLGIPVIKDLPVGKYLRDHVLYPEMAFRINQSYYKESFDEELILWTQAKRPLTAGYRGQALSFWNFEGSTTAQADVEMFFVDPTNISDPFAVGFNERYVKILKETDGSNLLFLYLAVLQPKSFGEVTLQSRDPRDFPLINPNFYSDIEGKDIENMYKAIQTAIKLANTEGMRKLGAEVVIYPVPDCNGKGEHMSKEWWYCVIKVFSTTEYHPIGTTRMGPDPKTSVVNAELKVHGIKNLRVVDAGVFPAHISGHLNAPVVMTAEKIADVIKAEHRAKKGNLGPIYNKFRPWLFLKKH